MANNSNHHHKPQMKFVVYGLYEIEPETLKTAFNNENIYPTRIVKMKMKHREINNELQNYLLYFDCKNIEKDQENCLKYLKSQVKSVYSCRVKWAKYENKQNGPQQCMRCLQFGHGDRNCVNEIVCFRCSEHHDSRNCRYFLPNTRMIPKHKVKCYFCGGSHTALSIACQVRKQIINEWNTNQATESYQAHQFEADDEENSSSSDNDEESDQNQSENEGNNENKNFDIKLTPKIKKLISLKRTMRNRWQRTRDRCYKSEVNRLQKIIKEEIEKLRQKL